MSFRINTNITAMSAYNNSRKTDLSLNASLSHLSSGLRVEKAADDASGMTIADSLRAQASSLGQAISNGNDAIGIVQTADNAMDEQLTILNTIRTKAIQAAQDGQNGDSRKALQTDISRLLEELDNIATTTSFNGQQLLNGNFSNKNFQIGAYSNQTVQVSIGATESSKIGHTRFETSGATAYKGSTFSSMTSVITLSLQGIDGYPNGYAFQDINYAEFKESGLKAIADRINGVSDVTGVKASVNNSVTFSNVVAAGEIKGLVINGAVIGDINVKAGDSDQVLVNSINAVKEQTGVEASITDGKLNLTSRDGRSINIQQLASAEGTMSSFSNMGGHFSGAVVTAISNISQLSAGGIVLMGRLTLIRQDARDIVVNIKDGSSKLSGTTSKAVISNTTINASAGTSNFSTNKASVATVTLKDLNTGVLDKQTADALGYFAANEERTTQLSGVTTYAGAQAMIDVAESAQKQLDRIRANIGSAQAQIQSTINNISVTQVNVKAAESQIRDVDFATEASNFNKYNILAQSGSYALSQANTVQQNVLRLLQ